MERALDWCQDWTLSGLLGTSWVGSYPRRAQSDISETASSNSRWYLGDPLAWDTIHPNSTTVVLLLQTCCNIWLWVNQDIAKMLARGSNINAVWVCESANSSLLDCVASYKYTTMFIATLHGDCLRCLQSCMGSKTWLCHIWCAVAESVFFFVTSYTVRYTYVHVYAIAQYRCLRMSGPRDIDSRVTLSMLVIWVLIQNSYLGLQAPMVIAVIMQPCRLVATFVTSCDSN